ncbi:three component ABC system middle component [Algiphilus sp. W345]|uniref:Three component ABC system middle component n=1 Tax=Banduia mediterranea TaxID=3075609 RepID=A0ABU2WMS4_9GAMM|nr:three component ABC system middle component [Algiphilus sp. W345]MDT0499176.1 three component ABC system middle component [Algiphilus sp. W345]
MIAPVRWDDRVPEEAYLFNAAFCGLLIIEFAREYKKAKGADCPFVLPFCALPITLHPHTRSLLPSSTLTSMYTWLERNSNSIIGYKERAQSFRPVLQEAIRFAIDRSSLSVSEDGGLVAGPTRVASTPKFDETLSYDARDCINATKLLGRWFAKAGTTSTILSAWGIKP